MGRVTYESILANLGEPLPDRTSVVLTSRGRESLGDDLETSVHPGEGDDLERPTNVVVASDLQSALEAAERSAREDHGGTVRAFVGGGATVYEQFLPAVDRLFVTEIYDRPDGDTHFPAWNRDGWLEVERDERDGFAFLEYVRCS